MAPLTNLNLDEKGHTPKYCREQSVAQRMVGGVHILRSIFIFFTPLFYDRIVESLAFSSVIFQTLIL